MTTKATTPVEGAAIVASDLVVTFGDTMAVNKVSLSVEPGEVVALLGPNGAGKTTTLRCLEGYLSPTSGLVRVLGVDPVAEHRAVVDKMGCMLQGGGIYPSMRVRETLNLFAAYYPNPRDPGELSSLLGLNHLAKTTWRRLSGGEQQRLSLALALIGRPSVLFLDEPTAGVDPEGRLVIRDVVASLKDEGAAMVLTSHELSEVDAVADRLVFLAQGAVLAAGTRASLTAALESGSTFQSRPGLDLEVLSLALECQVTESRLGHYALSGSLSGGELEKLVTALAAQGAALETFSASSGLEDLYHALYADQPVQDTMPTSRRRRR